MLQIMIQGRGGQGAQTAGNLLAMAFFDAGKQVQCFASYGGARRGTPVSSTLPRSGARSKRVTGSKKDNGNTGFNWIPSVERPSCARNATDDTSKRNRISDLRRPAHAPAGPQRDRAAP